MDNCKYTEKNSKPLFDESFKNSSFGYILYAELEITTPHH